MEGLPSQTDVAPKGGTRPIAKDQVSPVEVEFRRKVRNEVNQLQRSLMEMINA
ncbi:hypothetical protein EV182_008655, partial [Spiromyces aspiralis]